MTWDEWRAAYPWMSHQDQVEFSNECEPLWPDQKQYDAAPVIVLCRLIAPKRVYELGGWKGELASDVLAEVSEITLWRNYELCPSIGIENSDGLDVPTRGPRRRNYR